MKTKKESFTLLEMMVVLAIIFIITAVALPNFWGWHRSREIKGAAGRIASILSTAKSYAQAQNTDFSVVFWHDGGFINLDTYRDFNNGGNWADKLGKSEKFRLTSGVDITTSLNAISGVSYRQFTFFPDGSVTIRGGYSEADPKITITHDGKKIDVLINEHSGSIRVTDFE